MSNDDRQPEEWAPTGQGEALPDFAGVDGQWLWKNMLFLYRSGRPDDAIDMPLGMQRTDDSWCPGINADALANQLGVSVDTLFEHNQRLTLYVSRFDAEPRFGGTRADGYRFRIGDRSVEIISEQGLAEGRA